MFQDDYNPVTNDEKSRNDSDSTPNDGREQWGMCCLHCTLYISNLYIVLFEFIHFRLMKFLAYNHTIFCHFTPVLHLVPSARCAY